MAADITPRADDLAGLDLESRQMVLDTIGQLRKRLLTKEKILAYDKGDIFPEDTIREMLGPEIGLQLLMIPEAYGGMGGGARDSCAITREMAKICLGVTTAFFAIQLGADPLIVGGTEEQKMKWLGRIAAGDTLVAYAVTEPDAGSNLVAIKTKAEPVTNNDGETTGYVINGSKQFISTGLYADYITVLANTPEGATFFVVEKGTEGYTAGKGEEKHGIRASNTSPLTFTDVFVPVENLIGGVPGHGIKQASKVFGYTRLMVAAMALGGAEAALEIAIPYAKERVQFKTTLSEKQGYTHKLIVPHVVRLAAADAYIAEVAERLDAGEPDLEVEGSIAKLYATEAANKAAEDCMQALGGYGYIAEYEVEKIKRDVRITCIYEGTSEIQQTLISTMRWKKTRKTKGEFYQSISDEMNQLHDESADLGCRSYALSAAALNQVISLVNDNRLTRQQIIMFALADMAVHVEIGASLARKARRALERGDSNADKLRLISRLFAGEVSQVVARDILDIVMGSGQFDEAATAEFLVKISHRELATGICNRIPDMDQLADVVFERQS